MLIRKHLHVQEYVIAGAEPNDLPNILKKLLNPHN